MKPKIITIPQLFIIAGTGKNSGKTTLACRIIEQFNKIGIVAIKISPHFHKPTPGLILLEKQSSYNIYEESNHNTGKDTSRMLKSGASKAFLVTVKDDKVLLAFLKTIENIPPDTPIICESPILRKFVIPGAFAIMYSETSGNNKDIASLKKHPHNMFTLENLTKEPLPFDFKDGKWVIK